MKEFIIGLFGIWFMTPFNIAGDSMEPTFSHDDTIMFESLTYLLEEPVRYDVVVFYGADEPDKIFVKRIIGMPGETILIREDKVYILEEDGDEVELEESYRNSYDQTLSLRQVDGTTYEVPEGKYFMLGDNRDHSFDSRTWHDPFIPKNSIVGRYYFELF